MDCRTQGTGFFFINKQKTVTIRVGKTSTADLYGDSDSLEIVDKYCYLVRIFSNKGWRDYDVSARIVRLSESEMRILGEYNCRRKASPDQDNLSNWINYTIISKQRDQRLRILHQTWGLVSIGSSGIRANIERDGLIEPLSSKRFDRTLIMSNLLNCNWFRIRFHKCYLWNQLASPTIGIWNVSDDCGA